MRILNGWKEIADYLHRTSRSARRWERLGLPVRRISNGRRSPVVAFSHELEDWMRMREARMWGTGTIEINRIAFRRTRHETRKLVDELKAVRIEYRRLLTAIHDSNRQGRRY